MKSNNNQPKTQCMQVKTEYLNILKTLMEIKAASL